MLGDTGLQRNWVSFTSAVTPWWLDEIHRHTLERWGRQQAVGGGRDNGVAVGLADDPARSSLPRHQVGIVLGSIQIKRRLPSPGATLRAVQ